MDISKCEVSWDYTLTDAEGKTFTAGYGLRAEDNPFGYAVAPLVRNMHDYTAKRPGLSSDKSQWVYGQDYVYCFCIEHGIPLPDDTSYAGSSNATHGDKYEQLSTEQKDLLSLALAYGYPNRTDLETSADANACYSATQLIVWQITLGFRASPTELHDKTYPVSGYTGTMTEQYCRNKYFKNYYDRILSDMAAHYKRPSFTGTQQSSCNFQRQCHCVYQWEQADAFFLPADYGRGDDKAKPKNAIDQPYHQLFDLERARQRGRQPGHGEWRAYKQ